MIGRHGLHGSLRAPGRARALLAVYVLAVLWIFLLKGITVPEHIGPAISLDALNGYRGSINLIPGKTIFYYVSMQEGLVNCLYNIGGNLLGFLPLGVLLPLGFPRFRRGGRVALTALVLSGLIELIQFLTRSGDCDIDDVLLNVAGAMLGYLWIRRAG